MPVIHKLNALPVRERNSAKLYKLRKVPQKTNSDHAYDMLAGEQYSRTTIMIFSIADKLAPIINKQNKLGKILLSFFENRLKKSMKNNI